MSNFKRSMAQLREGIRLALMAITANKFRSIMTIFGVTIGVGADYAVNVMQRYRIAGRGAMRRVRVVLVGSNPMRGRILRMVGELPGLVMVP